MTTAVSTPDLLPGYYLDLQSPAWLSLPWPGDPSLPWGHPERTALLPYSLGPQIIQWGRDNLVHHLTGEPWEYTLGQRRFIHLWYAFDPETGRWLYRSSVKRGAKGTGKDPFGGALVNTELVGPVSLRPDWRDRAPGDWGKAHRLSLVQIAANSEGQAKDLLRVANAMLSNRVRRDYGITTGETRTACASGSRAELLTASEKSSEGDPATAIFLNEALALDTPLPTPSGWTTMGTVAVGDVLVGRDGAPVVVTAATPVQVGRRCYRVTFADGTSVVASDGHRWWTKLATSTDTGTVRTTQQIVDAPRRCRVPRAAPMQSDDVDLPVDPYVLGLWLGDGDARAPTVTAGTEDVDEAAAMVEARGYATTRCDSREGAPRFRIGIPGARRGGSFDTNPVASLRARLLDLAVLGDKHIPAQYLRAGTRQRTDLLRGLMDSDGCITRDGFAVFVNDNGRIADGFTELARSLGQAPRRTFAPDARSRRGGCHRVTFTPRALVPVALSRKVARVRPGGSEHGEWSTIRSVVEVDSVPVRCVSVDAADHLFLAGDGWSVTHNSHHMTESSGGHAVAAVARRNVGKSPSYLQARLLELTNAHQQGADSVAERSFEAWQKQVSPGWRGRQDILYDSREAPPTVQLHDEDSLMMGLRAAYFDAWWADLERLRDEAQDPRTSVADSIRYYLNGLAAAEDAWIDPASFDVCAVPDMAVADREAIALFLDCSKSEDATGLVACRMSDGHVLTVHGWQRPHGSRGKNWLAPREEVDAQVRQTFERYRVVWFGVDPSPARDDEDESLYWMPLVDSWHRELGRKLLVWATPGAKGHAVSFDMRMSKPGGAERNRLFTEAAMQTAADIDGEHDDAGRVTVPPTLTHDGHPMLRVHSHNARRRPNRWGVTLGKVTRDSSQLVDLAVCMVGARMGRRLVLNSKEWRRAPSSGKGRVIVLS